MCPSRVDPPEFVASTSRPEDAAVEILFVPVLASDDGRPDLADLDEAVGGEWTRLTGRREFSHRLYEVCLARVVSPGWRAERIGFVSAGPAADLGPERLRRVAATCSHLARQRGARSVGVLLRAAVSGEVAARAIADGLTAAEFDAGVYKQGGARTPSRLTRCEVIAPAGEAAAHQRATHHGVVVGRAANAARALVNEPANVLSPRVLATRVEGLVRDLPVSVEVVDAAGIRDLGMNLLLAVAHGSVEPPRLLVLRYEPQDAPASPVLALVGKGVTFDSGGISIKPAAGMEQMKGDMAGAAAVAAAMRALAELGPACRVIGVIPVVENMPGGGAMRPGDVVTGASGTSVEIINTDAEGRLILADALWHARRLGATHVVDVATLTGACVVALGRTVSGLFGAPAAWVETVRDAGMRGGERLWPMPIYEEAADQLKSEIADLLNSGGRPGGAVTAAAFLREFAGTGPWAHLDIAGTSWADTRKAYQPKGATGVAVRTLVELGMTVAPARRS